MSRHFLISVRQPGCDWAWIFQIDGIAQPLYELTNFPRHARASSKPFCVWFPQHCSMMEKQEVLETMFRSTTLNGRRGHGVVRSFFLPSHLSPGSDLAPGSHRLHASLHRWRKCFHRTQGAGNGTACHQSTCVCASEHTYKVSFVSSADVQCRWRSWLLSNRSISRFCRLVSAVTWSFRRLQTDPESGCEEVKPCATCLRLHYRGQELREVSDEPSTKAAFRLEIRAKNTNNATPSFPPKKSVGEGRTTGVSCSKVATIPNVQFSGLPTSQLTLQNSCLRLSLCCGTKKRRGGCCRRKTIR